MWKQEVHHHLHHEPSDIVHIVTPHFLKISLNIIAPFYIKSEIQTLFLGAACSGLDWGSLKPVVVCITKFVCNNSM